MRLKIVLPVLMIVLLLSGCKMPFTKDKSAENIKFSDANARLLEASNEIDKTLMDKLTKTAAAKTNTVPSIADVIDSQKLQQNLYDTIQIEEVQLDISQIKFIYLSIINQRIVSYHMLLNTLNKVDYDLLTETVTKVKIKDAKQLEKSLIDLNYVLTSVSLKEKKTLYDLTLK